MLPIMIAGGFGNKAWVNPTPDGYTTMSITITDSDGTKEWKLDCTLHCENGNLHREGGPAIEGANGDKWWYKHGKLHREDGPAQEWLNGKAWWIDGERHREDGPAIEGADASKWWYWDGKLHREDGPAIEKPDGTKWWLKDGKLHREDGPAIEYADGTKEWFRDGKSIKEPNSQPIMITSTLGTKEGNMIADHRRRTDQPWALWTFLAALGAGIAWHIATT